MFGRNNACSGTSKRWRQLLEAYKGMKGAEKGKDRQGEEGKGWEELRRMMLLMEVGEG